MRHVGTSVLCGKKSEIVDINLRQQPGIVRAVTRACTVAACFCSTVWHEGRIKSY